MIKELGESEAIIYVENIEWAFKNNHIDEFCFWIILKSYDNLNGGTAKIKTSYIIDLIKNTLGLSKSTIYDIINNGNNIYWRKNKDNLFLFGIKTIFKNTNIKNINKYIYSLPIKYLFNISTKERRSILFCILISGNSTPQSYINIANRCNISRRTAINYVKNCGILQKALNYGYIKSFKTISEINEYLNTHALNPREHIVEDGSGFHLLKQMSNSYKVSLSRVKSNSRTRKLLGSPPQEVGNAHIYTFNGASSECNYIYKGVADVRNPENNWLTIAPSKKVMIWKIVGEKINE